MELTPTDWSTTVRHLRTIVTALCCASIPLTGSLLVALAMTR